MNDKSAVPLMVLLNINKPIKDCAENAANAPVSNTSLPKYFLLFFSLFSLYMDNILKPMIKVPKTNTAKPIRPK